MAARQQPMREKSTRFVAQHTHLMDMLGDANHDKFDQSATMSAPCLLQCAKSHVPRQQHLACELRSVQRFQNRPVALTARKESALVRNITAQSGKADELITKTTADTDLRYMLSGKFFWGLCSVADNVLDCRCLQIFAKAGRWQEHGCYCRPKTCLHRSVMPHDTK